MIISVRRKSDKQKKDNYEDLLVDGYLFQPLAVETQPLAGLSTQIFVIKLCKKLSICTEELRSCRFFKTVNLPGNREGEFMLLCFTKGFVLLT